MTQKTRTSKRAIRQEASSTTDISTAPQANSEEAHSGDSSVKSAERTLKILSLLGDYPDGLTEAEVRKNLNLPVGSAHDLMQTICKVGWLIRDEESKRFTLSTPAFKLAERATPIIKKRLKELAASHLTYICRATGIPAHLAIMVHGEALYIARVGTRSYDNDSTWINVWAGRMISPQVTAVGRALMCYLDPQTVKEIFESHPIPLDAPARRLSQPELMTKLAETRKRGYAIDDEETALGVRCVAAPVFGVDCKIVAAIGLSGMVGQLGDECLKEVATIVCKEAAKLSQKLGYDGSSNWFWCKQQRQSA